MQWNVLYLNRCPVLRKAEGKFFLNKTSLEGNNFLFNFNFWILIMIEAGEKLTFKQKKNNTNNIKPVYYIDFSFFVSHPVN
jgi:hypothetical protein